MGKKFPTSGILWLFDFRKIPQNHFPYKQTCIQQFSFINVPTGRQTGRNRLPYTYLKGSQQAEDLTHTIVPTGFSGLGLFYVSEVINPHFIIILSLYYYISIIILYYHHHFRTLLQLPHLFLKRSIPLPIYYKNGKPIYIYIYVCVCVCVWYHLVVHFLRLIEPSRWMHCQPLVTNMEFCLKIWIT
jgi:hypothetical protein